MNQQSNSNDQNEGDEIFEDAGDDNNQNECQELSNDYKLFGAFFGIRRNTKKNLGLVSSNSEEFKNLAGCNFI